MCSVSEKPNYWTWRYFSPDLRITFYCSYYCMCCILPYKVRIHLNLSPCQPPRSQLHGNRLLPQQKNQPTNHLPQLPRPRPPDYDRSIGEELEEESEVRKTMTDERGVVVILRVSSINLLFSLFSSLSLVSCCPQLSPKTIMSFHDKFLV